VNFQLEEAIEILERTPKTLTHLLSGLSEPWITCNEGEATWSAFDVIGHLIEGEKNNWTPRIQMIISKGETEAFPPFDRFSHLHQTAGKTMEQLLSEFTELRQKNIEKLRSFIHPYTNFEQTGLHSKLGIVKLRKLIAT